MNVLFLNLTRFGDLLQSQAAISDFAAQGHKVAIVCQENFSSAAMLLKGVNRIFPFYGSGLLAALDRERDAKPAEAFQHWTTAVAGLGAWRAALRRDFAPDLIINLTPSLAARLLTMYLSEGALSRGFGLDEHGFGLDGNGWAAFLRSASQERGVSPFNVVDLFRKTAQSSVPGRSGDCSLRPSEESARQAFARMLRELAPQNREGFVGLQLGASEDRRQWPVEYFAELGDTLQREKGLCPVLFGSRAEQPLAKEYMRAASGACVDLVGQTSPQELAAGLSQLRLLITNDTGTMHLAAGLGVPVLAIFLATAQPFDTGPYQFGSCSIEPDIGCHPCAFGQTCGNDHACRRAIAPTVVADFALSRLETGRWPEIAGARVRAWEAFDDLSGFMALRSLSGHAGAGRSLWLALQRRYIAAYLDTPPGAPFIPPTPDSGEPSLPTPWRVEVGQALHTASELVMLFLQQGRVLAAMRKDGMAERLLATWAKVHGMLGAEPRFAALAALWVQETQAKDADLPAVLNAAKAFQTMLAALASELSDN